MKAKDKAKELVKKFTDYFGVDRDEVNDEKAKQWALISVDEILNSFDENYPYSIETKDMEWTSDDAWLFDLYKNYWLEVKQEIEKL